MGCSSKRTWRWCCNRNFGLHIENVYVKEIRDLAFSSSCSLYLLLQATRAFYFT